MTLFLLLKPRCLILNVHITLTLIELAFHLIDIQIVKMLQWANDMSYEIIGIWTIQIKKYALVGTGSYKNFVFVLIELQ